ncbi:MAG TPA: inner membrane CreD family protein [Vicinamibacteria bacterium]|nr:inner membrane CreD family protein [Vicinamibacteria bacterium]
MTIPRLLAIGFIFLCTAVAWSTLGASLVSRTGESDERLAREVAQLWGGRHDQVAPSAALERPREVSEQVQEKDARGLLVTREVTRTVIDRVPIPLDSSRVNVELALDQRRKGLLWYATYAVAFAGAYRLHNPDPEERTVVVHFTFPSAEGLYDGFTLALDGREVGRATDLSQGMSVSTRLGPGATSTVEVGYRSRGLGSWRYSFAPSGVAQVRDFSLDMRTDFDRIDFPAGTVSPTTKAREGGGWRLSWRFESLVTGQELGMEPPRPINPGPLAARITFFAPVSLLFFFSVMVVLGVLQRQPLHPVNYFFLAAAFFAFHLLLAYLVDHVNVHVSFALAAAISLFLVVSYLRLVGGWRLALARAGAAQLVFLVLFSYAFFFEGYTGLTVTIGAVGTLFVLMQVTARVDWDEVLGATAAGAGTARPAGAGRG